MLVTKTNTNMKTSQFFCTDKRDKVEIWYETVNGVTDYYEKINGVSSNISKRRYENLIKKYNLENK